MPTQAYDAVCISKDTSIEEVISYLREMNKQEDEASSKRFGLLRYKVIDGRDGWPKEFLERDRKLWDLIGMRFLIRAYRAGPEMLPNDFNWETIEGTLFFGGTLKDEHKRL
jgi:hypothetical protein